MRASSETSIEAEETATPGLSGMISMAQKARNTHSAIFVEVRVDQEMNQIRVTLLVNAIAAGRIINPKTARSQISGVVVMGIGMPLHEEAFADAALGRWMNHNYAEYHVPAHADVQDINRHGACRTYRT